ncbi:MAG: hypothetical protein IJM83_02100 [Firmicutes bacterium]|nr:hypothetical protein [Bacillota bacterium]
MKQKHTEQWVWLPEDRYPDSQTTIYSALIEKARGNYVVAEFSREYVFTRKVVSARIRFSADTAVQLFLNGSIIATGPASVGGDFIGNETARDNFYSSELEVSPDTDHLTFFARVRMSPVQICEYSKGHGGFMLSAILTMEDGTEQSVFTDESWQVRKNGAYVAPRTFDGRIAPDACVPAQVIENRWKTETAPIPVRSEKQILPSGGTFELEPEEKRSVVLDLDRIYAGFVMIDSENVGELHVRVTCREQDEKGTSEEVIRKESGTYRGFYLHSAGSLLIEAENRSERPARIRISFIETHYPVTEEAHTFVSDEELTKVLETCQHTLKICRQTHHLDSPRHCEPLACTGDYYIESLMTPFSFGDMRLARFDIIRTAELLERENGRMFHTTYSLIWVRMLYDVYMITGDQTLLVRCRKALELLLRRFDTYMGKNGLIEDPPDYMFVDWIYIDGISMHHPPKALGQSCLNMFFFAALKAAEKVFEAISEKEKAEELSKKSADLRRAINEQLFDKEKGIYFEGLNTPTREDRIGKWMPPNIEKRYYLKHSNILACWSGVCDDETGRKIVDQIMQGEIGGEVQPYFLHYLLEAVCRLGLREKYTLSILEKWKAPVRECSKGLAEGFVKPEPTYHFDHSHAWGGTPLYSLPKALLGLTIMKPGMKEILLEPSLLGLSKARVELLTPSGKMICEMKEGEEPRTWCPEDVRLIGRYLLEN